jgi:S-methylmethionine-dependent homocysteine/selenocysteine methylase
MDHLHSAGVDLVLIETMCSAHEAIAAANSAKNAWAISFCLQTDVLGMLLDGTPLIDIIQEFENAKFIGINCYPATKLAQQVKHLRSIAPNEMPIAAYGNVGYADDEGGWISTDAIDPERFAEYAMEWINAGATIVGGCCGTTPETIAAIHKLL